MENSSINSYYDTNVYAQIKLLFSKHEYFCENL